MTATANNHASDAALIRLIDLQPEPEDQRVDAHVAQCPVCSARLTQLSSRSRSFASLIVSIGSAPPVLVRRRRLHRSSASIAAGLAAAVVFAGVAAATPIGPWIVARIGQLVGGDEVTANVPAAPRAGSTPPTAATNAEAMSGVRIAVPADGGETWVAIEQPRGPVRVRLRLVDGTSIAVRGVGAAAAAEFRPAPRGIAVAAADGGEIQVDVPRTAARFVLRIGAQQYAVREGERLRVLAPRVDSVDTDLLFSVRPR